MSLSTFVLPAASVAMAVLAAAEGAAAPRLMVSENRRFLVGEDGTPFFWLGDTAWELFHRLNRDEADVYLQDRASKGFTVIQAVALGELDGLGAGNAYGHRPLLDGDPARPAIVDGPANDYWDHVDYIVGRAEALGLRIGMLPTWGDKWNKKWGSGPEVFTPTNAEVYGEWLGQRYGQRAIIWILGGDRPIESDAHHDVIRAMARGLKRGDGGRCLMTFHPMGGHGSSEWFHEDEWLDFNMRQNGHVAEYKPYAKTRADYDRAPTKPVIDGEPLYEDHPVSFNAPEFGHSLAADVRRPLYWDLFGGSLRTHLRAPLGLADGPARASARQRSAHALVRGPGPAGRRTDAARQAPHGVQALPHAGARRLCAGPRRGPDLRSGRRTVSIRGHPRCRGQLCHGLCPDRQAVQGPHGQGQWPQGQGLVVQPPQRTGQPDRGVPQPGREGVLSPGLGGAPGLGPGPGRRGQGLSSARTAQTDRSTPGLG